MTDQVEEVKSKIDIVSIIGEYIPLKKAGRNYKALCPFHSEKTPSFMVSPQLQIFKCFGCGVGGDAIAFLQKYEGMEFYEALKFLAEKVGVKLKRFSPKTGDSERLYSINSSAAYFYSWILLNHRVGRDALKYLTYTRGLKLDTIKYFGLGFSPEHPLALKKYLVDKKGVDPRDLERAGLIVLRQGEIIDRFRGRIVFPLCDHRGNVVGFSGRILPKDEVKGISKYINTPETQIYHKSKVLYALDKNHTEIKKENFVAIVEGEIDALSCWQVGIKNVVAIKGSSLTEEQVRLLSRFTDKFILAFDADFAGDAAVRRGIETAQNQGIEVRVARLSGFKDPDEAARKNPEKLKKAIENSLGAWDFIIDSVFKRYSSGSGSDKARIAREIVPILSAIEDSIVKAHYANIVARKLSVPTEVVLDEVEKFKMRKQRQNLIQVIQKPKTKSRRELLEERLLSLALKYNPKILLKEEVSSLVANHFFLRIRDELKNFYKSHKNFDPSLFASELPPELREKFIDLVLREEKDVEDFPEKLKKEIAIVARELEVLKLRQHLEEASQQIRELEKKGQKQELIEKEKEFKELTQKLSKLEEENFRGIIL